MTEERVIDLEEKGFKWNIYKSPDEWLKELAEYLKSNPGGRPKKITPLGRWVKKQQHLYNKKELSKEMEQSMKAVGFTFLDHNLDKE